MKKILCLLIVVLGLSLTWATSSQALYLLCEGWVRDQQGNYVKDAYVQGCCPGLKLTDYSNQNGYFALNHSSPPPAGNYDYCAVKADVGRATTTIYHTYGVPDSWYPWLSGTTYTCGKCPDNPGK